MSGSGEPHENQTRLSDGLSAWPGTFARWTLAEAQSLRQVLRDRFGSGSLNFVRAEAQRCRAAQPCM